MYKLHNYLNKTKDAGFVYKSFQNKTNQVIWKFLILQNESTKLIFGKQAYKTNPLYKSFEKSSTNRICNTNL